MYLTVNSKKIYFFTHYKHALLHLLVDFSGSFRSFPIFQRRFRWYQAVKKYLLSQHYVSILATAEAITQTKDIIPPPPPAFRIGCYCDSYPFTHLNGERPRGYSQEIWVRVCGPLLETLTLFQTKTLFFLPYFRSKIPYHISDQTLTPFRLREHLRKASNSRR